MFPPAKDGFILRGYKNLFNGEIVGYAMGNRITQGLVLQSLFRAVASWWPEKRLINRSDRGSQCCSRGYVKTLELFGIRASMSRKGDCYDNAPMESFWGTLPGRRPGGRSWVHRDIILQPATASEAA